LLSSHFPLLGLVLITATVGFTGIGWYRWSLQRRQAFLGIGMFLGALSVLSVAAFVLAIQPQRGILSVGLGVGLLLIAMSWGSPLREQEPTPIKA
jgi:uncharacterized membrane protein HdeD (DUF308 family)